MLTPQYLDGLPSGIIDLYGEVEKDILADMARRLSTYDYWIPAADWQAVKLQEAGVLQDDIVSAMAAATSKSTAEVRRMMQEAGSKTLNADAGIYSAAGLSVPSIKDSVGLANILTAGYKATNQTMKNLTRTTANTATKQFENALDKAWLKVQSGGFSTDTAVRDAIKELSEQGVWAITYPSGRTDSLEVAVRRAAVTGVNQTAAKLQECLADELGCDLVETTAHAGARPEHAEWQGKIFSRSGKSKKYPDFRQATGYGTGAGLCGWNCRHSFNPYFDGSPRAYTDKMLKDYDAKDYEYNGQKMTEYEATQKQREIERNIRRWKRENVAMSAAGQDATESARKLKQWQEREKDFIDQTGLKRQSTRSDVAGFGRSEAAKANAAAQRALAGVANPGKAGIINMGASAQGVGSGAFPVLDQAGYKGLRQAAGTISPSDRATIWDHTSGYIQTGNSWRINQAMRDGTTTALPQTSQTTISVLQKVIDSNVADRNFTAVRYADNNYLASAFGSNVAKLPAADIAAKLTANNLGDIIQEKSFMSVSMDPSKNVFKSKAVKLIVQIPDGAHLYASSNFVESEAIMRDGVKYMLREAEYKNGQTVLTVRVID